MANRTSCKSGTGKTILVDPNKFDGQDSSTNVSVPLEDLSITVELTTERKARTILTTTKDNSTGESSSTVKVSFLEGTEVNGKKVLTTSFTDLTTSFDSGNDSEGLGITSIDIDFNSSYAPLITINFIDIRGTAIFQNENNVGTGKNKFSTFFQLPYPLFQLTIKGYYGMPVSYCLHMTKFNSKFNSQTGNFEITASFIGYTYAMLSDMLLGFLKAIPYTKLGGAKYEKELINTETNIIGKDGKVLTLNGLIDSINAINVDSQKIASDDPDVANIKNAESKHSFLESIKTNLYMLGGNLDTKDLDEYQYIVLNETLTSEKITSFTTDYQTSVKENIDKYNENNLFTIDVNDFKNIEKNKYIGLTLNLLTTKDATELTKLSTLLNINDINSESFNNLRKSIYSHVTRNEYGFPVDKLFTIINLTSNYSILTDRNKKIDKEVERLQTDVALKIKASITKALGFDPTVRNIINVFTAAAEVFLSVIYDVSEAAKKSDVRTIQLEKFKNTLDTSYDYKANTNATDVLSSNYYPWPDYRELDEKKGMVEEYLGKPFVLDIPSDVDELFFIDDLLNAFIKSKQAEDQSALALEAIQENWVGANPIDTRLFGNDKFPYSRIEGLDFKDIINLMMIRFMTYIFSNRNLTAEEIQAIAKVELESALKWSVNPKSIQALGEAKFDYFKDAEGMINAGLEKIIMGPISSTDEVDYYNYIGGYSDMTASNANSKKIIPINDGFTGNWNIADDSSLSTPTGFERRENGSLFLTNYTQTKYDPTNTKKPDDGGYYVKVFTREEYTKSAYPTPVGATPSELSLTALKTPWDEFTAESANFNVLGGAYGVQEFFQLDWGDENLKGLPFRYLFYGDGIIDDSPTNKTNGLALKRKYSKNDAQKKLAEAAKDDKSGILKALAEYPRTPYDTFFTDIGTTVLFRLPMGSSSDNSLQAYMNYVDDDEKEGIDGGVTTKYRVHDRYGETRSLANALEKGSSEVCYPYINFQVRFDHTDDASNLAPVSLFGSRFYYAQTNDYSRALLFLHTFPWTGLINEKDEDTLFSFKTNNTIFDRPEIYNTFGQRAGFVSTPMLWTAFIGAMLWRADYSAPIMDGDNQTDGGSGIDDPIIFVNGSEALIPGMEANSHYPTKLEFLTKRYGKGTSEKGKDYRKTQMTFDPTVVSDVLNPLTPRQYKYIGETLLGLPEQAKNEFKQAFFSFVSGEFKNVRAELEVLTSGPSLALNDAAWKSKYDYIKTTISTPPSDWTTYWGDKTVKIADMKSQYKSFDNYIIFAQLYDFGSGLSYKIDNYDYNYVMEIKDDSPASELILNLFKKELIIANTSFKPWGSDGNSNPNESELDTSTSVHKVIGVTDAKLRIFVDTILLQLKEVKDGLSESNKKKQIEQELFGTADENLIKLQLYRTCKNIYDKWIGGSSDSNNIIFQCGGRNTLDYDLVKKRTNNASSAPKLIDSFRFVTRSFRDIGDEMVINPSPVVDILRDNPNTSFYDAVTNLLSSNNFDFIPLPSYINYGDEESLSALFRPISTSEGSKLGSVGPSFVCVYVGQKSKHLEYDESEYTNDGFDIRCDSNGNFNPPLPKDFEIETTPHENQVAVFAVNYSQQNQNIFKDITLDQSEFSETAESLQIIDDISKKGSENNKTLAGQNMYNVYGVRSYKTEVEMMGNAMIQPMMYFQLNNIPMFHGAYMITHVKHSIKPNFMSTNFTGVRIRQVETPLLDVKDLFMSLIDTMTSSNVASTTNTGTFGATSGGGGGTGSKGLPPIVETIREMGGNNGNMPNLTSPIGKFPTGIYDNINDGKMLLTEAIAPLNAMLTEWVAWMIAQGFTGEKGVYAKINSAFRTLKDQQETKNKAIRNGRPKTAAEPGSSRHGWGIAIDFQFFRKNGKMIFNYNSSNQPNVKEGYDFKINEAIVWLLQNSYRFGWIIPEELRDDKGTEEFWHFEYHGTSAACLLNKRSTIKGLVIDVSKKYDGTVKNPNNAKYENCDYKTTNSLDGTTDSVATPNANITVIPPSADDIDFYKKVLTNIGAPHSDENLKFFYAWRQAESGKAAWNPFNTTKKADGTTNYNNNAGYPVKNYPTREVGIKATSDSLNATYYKKIVSGLKNNIGAGKIAAYVDELKTWGTGSGVAKVLHGDTVKPTAIENKSSKIVGSPNVTQITETPDITISLPPNETNGVHVFVFYPGITVNGKKGKDYMPALIKSAVPSWYDDYVIVIPNEYTTDWKYVEEQFLAKMKEKGLSVKSLNLGIFSGSGNNTVPIMKKITSLKLNNLILMDPVPNALASKMSAIKAKGTKVCLEYNPRNWDSTLASGFPALAAAVGTNSFNTNVAPSDHMKMPYLTLTRYKSSIEAALFA